MSLQPTYKELHEVYEVWRDYLLNFPWQWLASLTFLPNTNYFYALRRFESWFSRLQDKEQLVVGASLLSSTKRGHLHFHALMLGFDNEGRTLHECSKRKWETAWFNFARIKSVESNFAACDYLAKHFLPSKSDYAGTEMFGSDLLKNILEIQDDEEVFYEGI